VYIGAGVSTAGLAIAVPLLRLAQQAMLFVMPFFSYTHFFISF